MCIATYVGSCKQHGQAVCRSAQVWVHALYTSLLSTELPPAAVEGRASRTFYCAPWELDDT